MSLKTASVPIYKRSAFQVRDVRPASAWRNEQTTPLPSPYPKWVTITHPFHPLRGQQVQVLRVHPIRGLTFVILPPDGQAYTIPAEMTDYVAQSRDGAGILLDVGKLRQIRSLADTIVSKATAPLQIEESPHENK